MRPILIDVFKIPWATERMNLGSLQSLVENMLRSGLFTPGALRQGLSAAPPGLPAEPEAVAEFLVAAGQLTPYQAGKLLRGVIQGLVFGPFHVLDLLGQGAMGNVYQARDQRTGRLRALKILPPHRAQERLVQRFQREMVFSQMLDHPHIARCYEVGRHEGVYYLVLDCLPGRELGRMVETDGPLRPSRATRVFAGLASGLAHAHSRGLTHRDLSPSNLVIDANDHAWIVDFGLALLDSERTTAPIVTGASHEQCVVGTAGWIAPEQICDPRAVDARADLFSLGCCLYLALTGRPPFQGASGPERLESQRRQPSPSLDQLPESIPMTLLGLMRGLLNADPSQRPDAAEVHQRLASWSTEPGG